VEVQREVHVRVHPLLEGELDAQADRAGTRLTRAAVGGLHQARAAAGYHRETLLAERAGHAAAELVLRMALGHPGRAPDRDRRSERAERLEAHDQLVADERQPLLVGLEGRDRRPLGAEDLLVR
jgi:hypothetical protein